MSRVTRTIAAPTSVVWEVFTDLASRPTWLSEVERIEILTPGPFGPGTRWSETRRTREARHHGDARPSGDGRVVTEELVVTSAEPPSCVTMALAGAGSTSHLTYLFAPIEVGSDRGRTTVTAIAEGRPQGRASRFLAFVLGGLDARTVEGALRDELDSLAAASEARGDAAA
jgi:uncharacterized protein YndB with AHSA1/START domain